MFRRAGVRAGIDPGRPMPKMRFFVNVVGPVLAGLPLAIVCAGPVFAEDASTLAQGSVVTLAAPETPADEAQLVADPDTSAEDESGPGAAADLSAPNPAWTFSAERDAGGAVTLSGMVPNPDVEHELAAQAGADTKDELKIGQGAPENFVTAARAGLDALAGLDRGRLGFADGKWSLTGAAASTDAAQKVQDDLAAAVDTNDWTIDISAPGANAAQAQAAPNGVGGAEAAAGGSPEETIAAEPGAEPKSGEPATEAQPGASESEESTPAQPSSPTVEPSKPAGSGGDEQAGAPVAAPAVPSEQAEQAAAPENAAPGPAPQTAGSEGGSPQAASPPASAEPYRFSATREADGTVALEGSVPPLAARRYFGLVAGNVPIDRLEVAPGAPEGFTADATGGLHALAHLESGSLSYDGQHWTIRGKAPTRAALDAAKAEIAALPDATNWSLDIAGPSPLELCRQDLTELAKANAITFGAGSARITPSSSDEIESVAKVLATCPEAKVEVEGHTDSDGDARANLALSVARAEAVVAALTEKGINPDRLYAVGYGETRPIVPNDTPADKARNRRIGFTVGPE